MSSQAQWFFKVAGFATAALVVLFLVTPKENRQEIKEALLRLTGDPGQLCYEHVKKSLVDPRSAEFVDADVSGTNVLIHLRARTAGGMLKTLERACSVSEGKLNEVGTGAAESSRRSQLSIECLSKNIAFNQEVVRLMQAGLSGQAAEESAAKNGFRNDDCTYRD